MQAIKRFKELERKQDQEAARKKAYRRRAVGDPLVPKTDRSSVEKRGVLKLYHNKSGDACLATAGAIFEMRIQRGWTSLKNRRRPSPHVTPLRGGCTTKCCVSAFRTVMICM